MVAGGATAATVSVPFVGCESEGQADPLEAPSGKSKDVSLSASTARRLAWYKAELGFGVLAPRGWHCLGVYGSGGGGLYVSAEPIDRENFFSVNWKGSAGPVVYLGESDGESSGGFDVARVAARVFPAYWALAKEVRDAFDLPANEFPFGPFSTEKLHYKGRDTVEYLTPANTGGLGTHYELLRANSRPIRGVAMLLGEPPSLLLLSVRLPPELASLSSAIIQQTEREASVRASEKH